MSLMRLLTVGRSFMTGAESGRYTMATKGALPRFESVKRFHPALPAPAATTPAIRSESTAAGWPSVDPGPAVVPMNVVEASAPGAVGFGPSETSAAFPELQSLTRTAPLTHAQGWFQRKRTASAKALRLERPPSGPTTRQAWLSLDEVHVVRNDLADCDYEVLPAPVPKPDPAPAERGPERSRAGALGMAWYEAAARLFHSERARV